MTPEPDLQGGAFLVAPGRLESLFTAEDLDETQRAIADTVNEFWNNEIAPNVKALLNNEPGLARRLLKKAAGIGLMGISIPERFGGMELDLLSTLVIAEHIARDASYMVWEGGHTTIGSLPIVYFGTEEQKQRYLPRLANLDLLAAYALTEPQAGSDALASRTRATLNGEGTHYVLNGQKMWITSASEADLFVVFARVDGQHFTAFLVERDSPGLRIGAEERKMGLKGSSTTALYLDDVPVPVGNVLGEVGRGHVIAFNILNLGRLKMGASTLGAAREVLGVSIAYARDRWAFGSPIARFGAIRHKLAEMAIRIFANESIVWRTAGLIDRGTRGIRWDHPDAASRKLAAVREYSVECSIVKVFGSEMLDYVTDEGVQIHGGYGYHQDYYVEKAYRDSRINRIFEGTNEINRLLITRTLLKRAASGDLPLWERVENRISHPETKPAAAREITLTCFELARNTWPRDLSGQQEILMHLADLVILLYSMESVHMRAEKLAFAFPAGAMARVYCEDALGDVARLARNVVGACSRTTADAVRSMEEIDRLSDHPPSNLIALREEIAADLVERGV